MRTDDENYQIESPHFVDDDSYFLGAGDDFCDEIRDVPISDNLCLSSN